MMVSSSAICWRPCPSARRSAMAICSRFPTLAILVLACLGLFPWDVTATPVRGMVACLNNEDCRGAHRLCHRNETMLEGVCTCRTGFKPAKLSNIKCLNIMKHECHTTDDCPVGTACERAPLQVTRTSFDRGFEEFPYTLKNAGIKQCFKLYTEPKTGGGLLPGPVYTEQYFPIDRHSLVGTEYSDGYYHAIDRRNRHYIKFVEDAMLVLFLLCVLVTLLVVHRASCYRQFRNSRRNGPLRYIIPHRDDQPPPYSNYSQGNIITGNDNGTTGGGGGQSGGVDGTDSGSATTTGNVTGLGKGVSNGSRRGETPPPTYAEALLISQAIQASMASANRSSASPPSSPAPLYVALTNNSSSDSLLSSSSPVTATERSAAMSPQDRAAALTRFDNDLVLTQNENGNGESHQAVVAAPESESPAEEAEREQSQLPPLVTAPPTAMTLTTNDLPSSPPGEEAMSLDCAQIGPALVSRPDSESP